MLYNKKNQVVDLECSRYDLPVYGGLQPDNQTSDLGGERGGRFEQVLFPAIGKHKLWADPVLHTVSRGDNSNVYYPFTLMYTVRVSFSLVFIYTVSKVKCLYLPFNPFTCTCNQCIYKLKNLLLHYPRFAPFLQFNLSYLPINIFYFN